MPLASVPRCVALGALLLSIAQKPREGDPVEVAIDASDSPLAGHGPSRLLEITTSRDGQWFVWARSAAFDPYLRVDDAAGNLLGEDDDSGGGTAACVSLELGAGKRLRIRVASDAADGSGRATLAVVVAPETDATRAAAEEASDELAEIRRLRAEGRVADARARTQAAVDALSAAPGAHESWRVGTVAGNLSNEARDLGVLRLAERAGRMELAVVGRSLPEEHPTLQDARERLGVVLLELGEPEPARDLLEAVFGVRSKILREDAPVLLRTRQNLAEVLRVLGQLERAVELQEDILRIRRSLGPEDDPEIQEVRVSLAGTVGQMGDLERMRTLGEEAVESYERTRPADDPALQRARHVLAGALYQLRDFAAARSIEEQVYEVQSRTLPENHPSLQTTRVALASLRMELGDPAGARELQECALAIYVRDSLGNSVNAHTLRIGLAISRVRLGDLAGARALLEQAQAGLSRTLPEEHPTLLAARHDLALVSHTLGDHAGARALLEQVLEIESRRLPDDHPIIRALRSGLSVMIADAGDLEGALALEERLVEIYSQTLPEDHQDLQRARFNLASVLGELGQVDRAVELKEGVLEVMSRALPADDFDLRLIRLGLAAELAAGGRLERSRDLCIEAIGSFPPRFPSDHPQALWARAMLTTVGLLLEDGETRGRIGLELASGMAAALAGKIASGSPREVLLRAALEEERLGQLLSAAHGMGILEPDPELERAAALAVETLRAPDLFAARIAHRAGNDPEIARLRREAEQGSALVAQLVQGPGDRDRLADAITRRDAVQRTLAEVLTRRGGSGHLLAEPTAEALTSRLGPTDALVAYRRYQPIRTDRSVGPGGERPEILLAHVYRAGRAVQRRELGSLDAIEGPVDAWRGAVGASDGRGLAAGRAPEASGDDWETGIALRRLLFDPLLPELEGARRIVVVPDDLLHGVPFDALPEDPPTKAGEKERAPRRLGDRLRIETRVTLREILAGSDVACPDGKLVALGGADFAGVASEAAPTLALASSPLRGGAWERGFAPLKETAVEARSIASLYGSTHEESEELEPVVLEGLEASREAITRLAPSARYLHVATHGWFAPESIRSWEESGPSERTSGMGARMSAGEQVENSCPMVLCGLAFSGANLPADGVGRFPGLVTAEEISTWDLTRCELAVLSACDTNVGVRRAGQGVASLQKALHMAGARSVITSLWKVPDEATRELMVEFYRRIWVEKEPKALALWGAKRMLRERGAPTRDWAAWVLTGEPD